MTEWDAVRIGAAIRLVVRLTKWCQSHLPVDRTRWGKLSKFRFNLILIFIDVILSILLSSHLTSQSPTCRPWDTLEAKWVKLCQMAAWSTRPSTSTQPWRIMACAWSGTGNPCPRCWSYREVPWNVELVVRVENACITFLKAYGTSGLKHRHRRPTKIPNASMISGRASTRGLTAASDTSRAQAQDSGRPCGLILGAGEIVFAALFYFKRWRQ